MYNHIHSERTKEAIAQGKKFIVGYLLAGYKDESQFFETMKICENHHIDILEIGFPSKHPYADGEIIRNAHKAVEFQRATSLEYWKEIRQRTNKPIWLMAYYEDFIATNIYKEFAKARIIDALVIPDADNEIKLQLQTELKEEEIDIIGFVNPEMDEQELSQVLSHFSIVYEQLYVGQTGVQQNETIYQDMLKFSLKNYPHVTCFGGFGLKTPQKIKEVLDDGFYGAVIGTEIIKKMNASPTELASFLKQIDEVKR